MPYSNEEKILIIARLETLNKDSKILLMGEKKPITVREMIEEVKRDSELGRKIVRIQMSYLKALASGGIDL